MLNSLVESKSPSSCSPVSHSFEPRDPWEVDTPHGRGIVLYITVYGAYANDLFCVANKADGRIRHYQTDQINLTCNYTLSVNPPAAADGQSRKIRALSANSAE